MLRALLCRLAGHPILKPGPGAPPGLVLYVICPRCGKTVEVRT